ncbi:Adenylate cyclase [Chitinispirillum alkaliphilum]|nr:Adenylate cyclase [Chitinispirillum alkaliphilum]
MINLGLYWNWDLLKLPFNRFTWCGTLKYPFISPGKPKFKTGQTDLESIKKHSPHKRSPHVFLAIFFYLVFALTRFETQQVWKMMARPVLTIIVTYTAIVAYRFMTEEKDRKFLQNTFKQYLFPELIDTVYKNKQKPSLRGDEVVRSTFSNDIEGFSTYSEQLRSPTRLVELLNEYLTVMTEIFLSHYGTLYKYERNAIIAFFGAPVGMADQAVQACLTALQMQKALADLRGKWRGEGDKWPQIIHNMRMRIGINSGLITTGNMGSAIRTNYHHEE